MLHPYHGPTKMITLTNIITWIALVLLAIVFIVLPNVYALRRPKKVKLLLIAIYDYLLYVSITDSLYTHG